MPSKEQEGDYNNGDCDNYGYRNIYPEQVLLASWLWGINVWNHQTEHLFPDVPLIS
jgi:hypothetical protein